MKRVMYITAVVLIVLLVSFWAAYRFVYVPSGQQMVALGAQDGYHDLHHLPVSSGGSLLMYVSWFPSGDARSAEEYILCTDGTSTIQNSYSYFGCSRIDEDGPTLSHAEVRAVVKSAVLPRSPVVPSTIPTARLVAISLRLPDATSYGYYDLSHLPPRVAKLLALAEVRGPDGAPPTTR